MNLEEIGYFTKAHGIKGHLILKLDRDVYIDEVKALFTESGGSKVPHFISEVREKGDGLMILLEDINDLNKAKLLTGKKVFADSEFIAEEEGEHEWTGYELVDHTHGSLGKIIEVSDNGQQLLVSFMYKGKEIILPLVDDLIERIDDSKKQIYYRSPEGLIDLYLELKD